MNNPVLDPETQAFLDTIAGEPELLDDSESAIAEARRMIATPYADEAKMPPVDIEDRDIPVGPKGNVSIRIVRPKNSQEMLPVVMFFHGGAWIFCDKPSFDPILREIATGAQAAVVFVDYSLSPEVRHPIALEECYAATQWIAEQGHALKLDPSRLAVVGDSAGGNLTIAVTLLAKERNGPALSYQVLIYPSTDGTKFDTESYEQYAKGYFFTRVGAKQAWDLHVPDVTMRKIPTLSPLLAPIEQLRGLPPALVITAECDPVRDEGEAYARRLIQAGVPVVAIRYLSTIHPFVTLNPLVDTLPARAAIAQIADSLRRAFAQKPGPGPM